VCILDCWYACIWRSSLQRVYRHACICLHHDLAEDKCLCSVCVCVCLSIWEHWRPKICTNIQVYAPHANMQASKNSDGWALGWFWSHQYTSATDHES
jgi:hypothetical protein